MKKALLVVSFGLCLAACGSSPNALRQTAAVSQAAPTATATLGPAFASTAESAQANAQATIAAGEAYAHELSVSATANAQNLSVSATALALELVSARATDEAVVRQAQQTAVQATTEAQLATATALAATAQAQATAQAVGLTQQALAVQTQRAAQTATAWPPQATQTQVALNTITRLEQQREAEAFWQRVTAWFWPMFWIALALVCAGLLVTGLILAFRRLLPTLDLSLRTRRGANGETEIAMLDQQGNMHLVLPGKSAAPILSINAQGVVQAEGMAANPTLQQQALTQEALLRMMTVLASNPQAARNLWQSAMQQAAPAALGPQTAPAAAVVVTPAAPAIRQAPDQGDVAVWLDEIETKILTIDGGNP